MGEKRDGASGDPKDGVASWKVLWRSLLDSWC
jgi:hypothetical protein